MPLDLAFNPSSTAVAEDVPNQPALLTDDDIKQIKRRSVRGAISFLLRDFFIQLIGLASAAILSAYFRPSDFGIYGFVIQIIGILTFVSDIGFAAALVQKHEEPSLSEYRTTFTVQQILAWAIFGICLILIGTGFIQAKTGPAGAWVLLALGLSFPLACLKTISSVKLERKLEFSQLAIPQIFEQVVFEGILIVLAIKGVGVMAYTYAIIARGIIGAIVMWRIQPWDIGLSLNVDSFKKLINFGAKFQLNDLLARIKDELFTLVTGLWLNSTQFGYVQWAKTWSLYPYTLTVGNVLDVTFPTYARLQHRPDLLKKAIEKSLFFITLCIFPILIGMSLSIGPLTHVIGHYNQWQPAVLSFILFCVSIIGAAISTPLTNTLNALGKINATLKLMLLWTALTWTLTPLAIYFYGFNGVAIASFVISLTSIAPIFILKRYVAFSALDPVWRQSIAALAMAGIGLAASRFMSTSLIYLFLGMLFMGLTYFVVLALIGYKKVAFEIQSLLH